MIKKYSLFIIIVIFSLSQLQLYGMDQELFFESFGFNQEENSSTTPDFVDQTQFTSGSSSDFGNQDTFLFDDENKNLVLPSFDDDQGSEEIKEQNNCLNLFSSFFENDQNSTTNTVPLQNVATNQSTQGPEKPEVFLKKRLREDGKKSLKNQSEQKKTRFNKNGASSSKAVKSKKNPLSQPTSYWIQNPQWWLKLAIELKPQVIINLLKKAGSSTEKLAEIEYMFDKNIMRVLDLLYWLLDPITENKVPPMVQIVTNPDTNQSFVHLKFILNLLNKKIYGSQDRRGTTQSIHYNALADKLELCISKKPNPECLQLIQMSINVIKGAPKDSRKVYYIFDGLSKLLNPQVPQPQGLNKVLFLKETPLVAIQPHIKLQQQNFITNAK